jgi:hypothetical protein
MIITLLKTQNIRSNSQSNQHQKLILKSLEIEDKIIIFHGINEANYHKKKWF